MTDLTRAEILEWFPGDRCPSCGGVTNDECNDQKACREVLDAIAEETCRRMVVYDVRDA